MGRILSIKTDCIARITNGLLRGIKTTPFKISICMILESPTLPGPSPTLPEITNIIRLFENYRGAKLPHKPCPKKSRSEHHSTPLHTTQPAPPELGLIHPHETPYPVATQDLAHCGSFDHTLHPAHKTTKPPDTYTHQTNLILDDLTV
jgi:hypothetical protein